MRRACCNQQDLHIEQPRAIGFLKGRISAANRGPDNSADIVLQIFIPYVIFSADN